MDTQNTPIHLKLWHRDFWKLAVVSLFLTMGVYLLLPVLPTQLLAGRLTSLQTGAVMGVYALGILVPGGFCNYLIQRYRRNQVGLLAMLGELVVLAGMYQLSFLPSIPYAFYWWLLLRFLLGACFGLAGMVLYSTLVVDSCESFQRTEANHGTSWFARFALSLGPMTALIAMKLGNIRTVIGLAMLLTLVSILLLRSIKFPFKAPEESLKVFSLDRFFLPQSIPLFLFLFLVTFIIGLLFSLPLSDRFYGMLMLGFLLALLSEKYVFQNANLKSETIAGLIAIGTAVLLMLTRHQTVVTFMAPTLVGFGIGIIGSRFLLFFIKLARHCQRGTSQSTFFLGWETGISAGLFAGLAFFQSRSIVPGNSSTLKVLVACLVLTLVCFPLYHFGIHPWYMKHRNR